jgi:hypothetical protein
MQDGKGAAYYTHPEDKSLRGGNPIRRMRNPSFGTVRHERDVPNDADKSPGRTSCQQRPAGGRKTLRMSHATSAPLGTEAVARIMVNISMSGTVYEPLVRERFQPGCHCACRWAPVGHMGRLGAGIHVGRPCGAWPPLVAE